jgi:hypothetical protein
MNQTQAKRKAAAALRAIIRAAIDYVEAERAMQEATRAGAARQPSPRERVTP